MKNISRHIGMLEHLERLPSSRYGNPRWQFYVAGVHARTAVDSRLGYSIDNYRGQRVVVEIGTHYGVPTLHRIERAPYGAAT